MARSRAQPIKWEYFWRLANQESVILPSLERKLRKNALRLNQSAISNFALYVITCEKQDGLYQNKVNSNLTSTHRPGQQAHSWKMDYSDFWDLWSWRFLRAARILMYLFFNPAKRCSNSSFQNKGNMGSIQILVGPYLSLVKFWYRIIFLPIFARTSFQWENAKAVFREYRVALNFCGC